MKLTEVGESRVRGYVFVLERSLSVSLPRAMARDAAREVESHIRERLDQEPEAGDEPAQVERVLQHLGPPGRVARAYSTELAVDEAMTTGRLLAVGRALMRIAGTTAAGFGAVFGVFTLAMLGGGFLAVAVATYLWPGTAGLIVIDGVPHALGSWSTLPPGARVVGGPWVISSCLAAGVLLLLACRAAAAGTLRWWRGRRGEWPPQD